VISATPRGFAVPYGRFMFNVRKFRSRNYELDWVKSSFSHANGNCVEVSGLSRPSGDLIGVRDSKDKKGPILRFTPDEWDAFLGGVRKGHFDRP